MKMRTDLLEQLVTGGMFSIEHKRRRRYNARLRGNRE